MSVRMELSRILIRELVDYQIIELREAEEFTDEDGGRQVRQIEDGRTFPIVIGLPEAQAIERRLSGTEIKRPQTHDLLASIIVSLGATLESIAITDLQEHTFFAELRLRQSDGKSVGVDCRPSDAIALGISENVPIYVASHVLDEATQEPPDEPETFIDDEDDEDDA